MGLHPIHPHGKPFLDELAIFYDLIIEDPAYEPAEALGGDRVHSLRSAKPMAVLLKPINEAWMGDPLGG